MNKNGDHVKKLKKSVIVVGRNYGNILTMVRALGRAEYEVKVLRLYKKKPKRINLLANMKPDAYSRYVSTFQQCIVNDTPEIIVDYLQKLCTAEEKRVLMPVDDYSAAVVDEYYDRLSQWYIIPNVAEKQGEIRRLMDKHEQKVLAAEFNLPMLHGVLIQSENGRFELPDDIDYPCFIKPNVSMKSTKGKMMKCEDRRELLSVLSKYAEKDDFEILIEPFADIKNEYSLLGLCTKDGVMAPGLFKATMGGHKERKGVAVMGEMISCAPFQKIINQCNDFIQSLHYTGLFDVDLIETKDGQMYFVELNFRAGASAHALTELGINLPGMLADYLLHHIAIDYGCELPAAGQTFVSEKVLMEEYVRNDTDLATFRRCLKTAEIYFIKDTEDEKPYRYFKLFYPIAAMLRIPYRFKDRNRKRD